MPATYAVTTNGSLVWPTTPLAVEARCGCFFLATWTKRRWRTKELRTTFMPCHWHMTPYLGVDILATDP